MKVVEKVKRITYKDKTFMAVHQQMDIPLLNSIDEKEVDESLLTLIVGNIVKEELLKCTVTSKIDDETVTQSLLHFIESRKKENEILHIELSSRL